MAYFQASRWICKTSFSPVSPVFLEGHDVLLIAEGVACYFKSYTYHLYQVFFPNTRSSMLASLFLFLIPNFNSKGRIMRRIATFLPSVLLVLVSTFAFLEHAYPAPPRPAICDTLHVDGSASDPLGGHH